MTDPAQYLNKSVQVICSDKRNIYGVLSCISSPFSIILSHSVATHPSPLNLDIEFHYTPQFPAKYFTNDETIRDAYTNYNQATNENQKQELQKKVDEAKKFNDEFMKDKYYVGSVVIPGEHIEKKSEACLNYDFVAAPFTPNTFSLWRDIYYEFLQNTEWFNFVKTVDRQLFQKFLEKVREAYTKKLTYKDLKLDLRYDMDINKLESIFNNELKKQIDSLTIHLSYYQAQIEFAYDLLRRIHTYKFVQYKEEQFESGIIKDQALYQKYLDKMMKSFISNVQEIATEKIKEFCATGLIKNNSFLESGKSFVKQFLFNGGAAVYKFTNINLGLFIGGLIAEQLVSKVATKLMVQRISAKLDLLQLQFDQMTNELAYINSDLDNLIYKAAEEFPNNFEKHQQYISIFVQKNYKVVIGSDIIYCTDGTTIIQKQEQDDCIILDEKEFNLPVQEEAIDDESSIIHIPANFPDYFINQHF